jgi:hypothetical protein
MIDGKITDAGKNHVVVLRNAKKRKIPVNSCPVCGFKKALYSFHWLY